MAALLCIVLYEPFSACCFSTIPPFLGSTPDGSYAHPVQSSASPPPGRPSARSKAHGCPADWPFRELAGAHWTLPDEDLQRPGKTMVNTMVYHGKHHGKHHGLPDESFQ